MTKYPWLTASAVSLMVIATSASAQDDPTQKQMQAMMALAMLNFAEDNCLGKPNQTVINDAIRRPTASIPQTQREMLLVQALGVVEAATKKSSVSAFCIKVNESFGPQGNVVPGAWTMR